MPFVDRDGVKIFYSVDGPASLPPVVLSHGFRSSSNFFDHVVKALHSRYQTVVWDMRAHARSDAPLEASRYSKLEQIEDLRAVCEAAGVGPSRPAIFLGHSMGAYEQLLFHLAYPSYVRAFVIYASGPGFAKESGLAGWNKNADVQAARILEKGLKKEKLAGVDDHLHKSAEAMSLSCANVLKQRAEDPFFARLADGPLHLARRLDEINKPTCCIVGSEDKAFLGSSQMLASKIPGASLVTVDGCGHLMAEDAPEKLNPALLRVLQELCQPQDEGVRSRL